MIVEEGNSLWEASHLALEAPEAARAVVMVARDVTRERLLTSMAGSSALISANPPSI